MSRIERGAVALVVAALLFSLAATAETSKQEQRRRELQNILGIKQAPQAPEPAVQSPDAGVGPQISAPEKPATVSQPRPRAVTYFVDVAHGVLQNKCGGCHRAGAAAGTSGWVLVGDEQTDHGATLSHVSLTTPAQSQLLKKATGTALHGAGRVIAPDSSEYATLLRWIESGAQVKRETSVSSSRDVAAPTARSLPPSLAAPVVPEISVVVPPPVQAPPGTSSQASSEALPFDPRVHELLISRCSVCHAPGKFASATRYLTSNAAQLHFNSVQALIVPGSSAQSILHQRAQGVAHSPGAVLAPGSPELALLTAWIDQGASNGQGSVASSPAPSVAVPAQVTSAVPAHPGISLGVPPWIGALRLNGRFDLNYERTSYNNQPFRPEAKNALRSYHHFLFLSRQSEQDPLSITVELLTLQFWEVGLRISPDTWPAQISAKFGKVLVPFGGEPLFHQSYGGLAGFDQKVLPAVFAREGVTTRIQGRWRQVSWSGDLYTVAGYALKRPDAILNLQSDFAPLDDVRLGVGARLGASWGPISLWYSPYFNSLGFGRRLFLQALDLAIWRPRGIKVLDHFSLAAGLLRADVSGGEQEGYGGPGADYYHFASYLQLRYYPKDWLYVQYRQGLRTFANRRGLILDDTALTREDGSTHNVGVVGRWRGLSVGLFHFWNLEKVDEVPDDFTRLVVAFDF